MIEIWQIDQHVQHVMDAKESQKKSHKRTTYALGIRSSR